jgi:hypothetical protein
LKGTCGRITTTLHGVVVNAWRRFARPKCRLAVRPRAPFVDPRRKRRGFFKAGASKFTCKTVADTDVVNERLAG